MTNKINQAITRPTVAHGETINGYVYMTVTVGTGAYLGPLSITSNGNIFPDESFGAVGLILASASTVATVTNSGEIQGCGGAPEYGGSAYGNGGNAVDLDSAFIFTNKGRIFGGNGLYEAYATNLTNSGTIDGGNGGAGLGLGGAGGTGLLLEGSLFPSQTIRDVLPPQAQGFTLAAHDEPALALGQADLSPSEKRGFIEMALLRHAGVLF